MEAESLAGKVAGWAIRWAIDVIVASGTQVLGVAGIFFVFGLVLYWLERRTFGVMAQVFGFRSVIYATGWIGTSAHELSHALMCVVFGHRITEMSLFKPDFESGVLGYVNHAFDPNNTYQQLGRFFIGVAPILVGGAFLVGATYFFIPEFGGVISRIGGVESVGPYGVYEYFDGIRFAVVEALKVIFNPGNLLRWEFWAFLYVSISISSHLAPSAADMQGAWFGFGVIIGLVLMVNGIALAFGTDLTSLVLSSNRYLGIGAAFLSVAVLLSVINFLVSYLVAAAWYRLRHGRVPSPI